jgi:arsenite-transporting ATPase
MSALEPTLQNIVDSSLQWIFVGGKGGVGKTTTSSSLATVLARTPIVDSVSTQTRERRVLIISTDPAHNLSDAFDQKFSKQPTPVAGLGNLYAMEIDPSSVTSGEFEIATVSVDKDQREGMQALGAILKQAANTLPGIDEVTVFVEIMREVKKMQFDVVVFDTAPTGHTLRLLALPQTLNSTLDHIMDVKGIGGILQAAGSLMTSATGYSTTDFQNTLERWRSQIKEVQQQFTDNSKTSFVCVCIPEFLSVYETERLIQELMKYNIACENIVVNQLVLKPSDEAPCRMCEARKKIQGKYLAQIEELYEDFHVVKMPLLGNEVRGVPALTQFSTYLLEPYDADKHGYL